MAWQLCTNFCYILPPPSPAYNLSSLPRLITLSVPLSSLILSSLCLCLFSLSSFPLQVMLDFSRPSCQALDFPPIQQQDLSWKQFAMATSAFLQRTRQTLFHCWVLCALRSQMKMVVSSPQFSDLFWLRDKTTAPRGNPHQHRQDIPTPVEEPGLKPRILFLWSDSVNESLHCPCSNELGKTYDALSESRKLSIPSPRLHSPLNWLF